MTKKTGVANRRLMITKNSIMMLVMLVIIFLAVFAWYFINKNVGATGITVKAALPDEVEIAVTENGADSTSGNVVGSYVNGTFTAGKWSDSANFNGPFSFSNDVTSNGLVFIIPGFSSTENNESAETEAKLHGKIVNINAIPTTAKSNLELTQSEIDDGKTGDYYSVPFYLRSLNPKLCVKPTAYLAMAAENGVADADGNTDLTGTNSARKSIYGSFTSDALVAAMRVSISGGPISSFDSGTNTAGNPAVNESHFVWVPRPDLFLNIPYGTDDTDWTLTTGVKATDTLYRLRDTNNTSEHPGTLYTGETFKHNHYVKRYENAQATEANGVTYVADPSVENSENIALKSDVTKTKTLASGSVVPTLGVSHEISNTETPSTFNMKKTGSEDTADYYVYKYYLNLWIEGTDSEARRAMDTGKFSLYLEFGNS